MTIYKRIGSLILSLLLVVSMFSSTFAIQTFATTSPAFSIENKAVGVGEEFTVVVSLANVTSVYGGSFTLQYDSDLLSIDPDSYEFGTIVNGTTMCNTNYQSAGNLIRVVFNGATAIRSDGILITFTFTAKASGTATLSFNNYKVVDEKGSAVSSVASGSVITISPEPVVSPTVSVTSKTVTVGEPVNVPIVITDSSDVYGGNFTLQYDSSLLSIGSDSYEFGTIVSGTTMCNTDYQGNGNSIRVVFNGAEAVSSDGTIITLKFTAKSTGTASLKFTACKMVDKNGSSIDTTTSNGTVEIEAQPTPPQKELVSVEISSNPTKTTYYIGDSLNTSGLKLTLSYDNGTTETTTSGFTTSGFSSTSAGTKTITVSYQGFTDTFTVTVKTPSITLSSSSKTMSVGDSSIVTATTTPSGQSVTWTSSNTSVATVSGGTITAKAVGMSTITAKFTYNGYTYGKTCSITVEEVSLVLTSMSIYTEPSKTSYYIGDSLNTSGLKLALSYNDGSTEYTTSGFNTSGFSSTSAGTKTVTVSYEGFTDTFTINVKTPNITLSSTSKTVYIGYTSTITATTTPSGQSVTWTSSNTSVATVSGGTITAKASGSATITAKFTYNGYTYSKTCSVTVEKEVVSISIGAPPIKKVYYIGEKFDSNGLKLNVSYSDGTSDYISDGFTVDELDSSTIGMKTVVIKYEGMTTNFDVIVHSITNSGYKVGDIIEFGEYPQTRITDKDTVDALNAIDTEWISYKYYLTTGGSQSDFMKYKDVNYNGEKYRAVTFSTYRPSYLTYYTHTGYQDDNGYYTNVIYWFKYEPLRWKILDPISGLIMCESIIDAQEYTLNNEEYISSNIRTWLNDTFYNSGFNTNDKNRIKATTHDTYSNNINTPTTDFVFLLSMDELKNVNYGFLSDYGVDAARIAQGTDYAKCQGLYVDSNSNGSWFLRSSSSHDTHYKNGITKDGEIVGYECNVVSNGVRPALVLDFGTDVILSSVSICTEPSTTNYYIGDSLNTNGLKLVLSYSDGSIEYVTSGFTTSGFSSTTAGTKTVTVSYEEFTDTFTVTVKNPSITLSSSSKSMSVGDTSAITATTTPSGQTVTWTSSNTSVATVSGGTITAKASGSTTITAKFTYNGKTYSKTCSVTVEDVPVPPTPESLSVSTKPTKTTYEIGESLNTSGLKLKLTYSDGTYETITSGFTTSGFSSTTAGTKTVTVKYGDLTTTFTVTVNENVPVHDACVYTEAKKTIVQGSRFTYTVSLAGTYDGFSFEIASGNGLTVTDIVTTNSNINIDEIGDKWMVSVLGGLAKTDAEKEELVTVTVQVASDAELGARTLTLSNLMLSNESGDKVSAIKYEYASIEITDQIPGDINGDGTFDYYDVSKLYAYYRNKTALSESVDTDVNGDGGFDYYDVSKLYAIYRGKANFN